MMWRPSIRPSAPFPGAATVAGALALVFGLALAATACSGDEPEAATASSVATDGERGGTADEAGETVADGSTTTDPVDGDGASTVPGPDDPVTLAVAESGEGMTGEELEELLARRYEAFWLAFDRAREAPTADPSTGHPALAELAAGQQLDTAYAQIVDLESTGQAMREPDQPAVPGLDVDGAVRIRVDQVDAGVAEITACVVNDRVRYQVADGAVVGESVVTVEGRATMALADGAWKVIRSDAVAVEPGVSGCWLEGEDAFPL